MMKKALLSLIATVICVTSVSSAYANFVTFNLQWSGESFGNGATATGFITLDTTVLPATLSENNVVFPDPSVSNLGITISGASSGNGTFGLSDFDHMVFWTPSGLDLSKELIGQSLTNGCTYGTSSGPCGNGNGGDFNLFNLNPTDSAARGIWYFDLATNGGTGDEMLLTSMTPTVPEPATLALMSLGLVGFGVGLRKRA